jgi:hypothetical protein
LCRRSRAHNHGDAVVGGRSRPLELADDMHAAGQAGVVPEAELVVGLCPLVASAAGGEVSPRLVVGGSDHDGLINPPSEDREGCELLERLLFSPLDLRVSVGRDVADSQHASCPELECSLVA